MARQQGWLALVLALVIIAVGVLGNRSLLLGLDLQGGHQLSARVFSSDPEVTIDSGDLNAVKEVIRRRIDALGLAQAQVQSVGDDRIVVQLPGSGDSQEDLQQAVNQITKKAFLQFALLPTDAANRYSELGQERAQKQAEFAVGRQVVEQLQRGRNNEEALAEQLQTLGTLADELNDLDVQVAALFENWPLTGADLVQALAEPNPESQGRYYQLSLTFTSEGGDAFAALTKEVAGDGDRRLGILLDGASLSEATVGAEFRETGITGGGARITGTFSLEEARELEVQLQGGALPFDTEIIEQRSIGATLGADNIRRSLVAGLTGLALVALLMVVTYRLPGLVAVLALGVYALLNLAIYELIPVVLTLPGVAGFILSFGMAVDANVLVFERTREELRSGLTLYRAVEAGFDRAFSSIVDGSLTTLISCLVLGYLGSGLVRGFAITLGIGVSLSLFTALIGSRTLLRLFLSYPALRQKKYFLPVR